MIGRFEFARLASLAGQLPMGSRTVRRLDPRAAWGEAEYLLALIADNLAFMRYENAGGKGRKPQQVERPKPARPEGPRPHVGEKRTMALLFGKRG